jgi:release factor glutamine methyltransferase
MPLPLLMELVNKSAEYLLGHGIANGRREAEWIFAETLGLTRLDLYTRFDMPLEEPQVARLRELVARRGRREPLAYVLGSQEFRGLRLAVGPTVLVPRPETEELVVMVLAALPARPLRLLDVGTGSGAIALALKQARPDCQVEATDESAEALAVARANAARLGLEVAWHQGHLARHLAGPYDAVVANLPYVGDDERAECDPELAFEPARALFAGADGMRFIAELVADGPRLLADDGTLWLEHGFRQGQAVSRVAAEAGLACAIIADAAGHERFARLQWSRA